MNDKYLKENLISERSLLKSEINILCSKNDNNLKIDIIKWLNKVKIRCKKSTYSNYLYTVNSRIIPFFENVDKSEISSELIDNYTSKLLNEGLLPKTVKDTLIILQQILIYAKINIKITFPKVPKKEIQILSKEEQPILENELLNNINLIKLEIYFCMYTGLRLGELCALKWKNIDIENK